MRITAALSFLCVAGCVDTAQYVPPVPTFTAGDKADAPPTPACSQEYWTWLNATLIPMLDKPISEASAEDVMQEVAQHPDAADDNEYAWNLCFQPVYNKYLWSPVVTQLHDAYGKYVADPSIEKYTANLAPSAELTRNATAIAALLPAHMDFDAYHTWMFGYSTALAEVIHPVGVPGVSFYTDVQEPEWIIDDAESKLLAMLEVTRAEPVGDSCFNMWMSDYKGWLFGPPAMGNEMVFEIDGFLGAQGVQVGNDGHWYVPQPVRAFLDRLQATRPVAIGESDTEAWLMHFVGYVQSWAYETDPFNREFKDLKVRALEEVMPAHRIGLHQYEYWLELASMQGIYGDAVARERVQKAKPCVASADLAAATQAFAAAPAAVQETAAPQTCD